MSPLREVCLWSLGWEEWGRLVSANSVWQWELNLHILQSQTQQSKGSDKHAIQRKLIICQGNSVFRMPSWKIAVCYRKKTTSCPCSSKIQLVTVYDNNKSDELPVLSMHWRLSTTCIKYMWIVRKCKKNSHPISLQLLFRMTASGSGQSTNQWWVLHGNICFQQCFWHYTAFLIVYVSGRIQQQNRT